MAEFAQSPLSFLTPEFLRDYINFSIWMKENIYTIDKNYGISFIGSGICADIVSYLTRSGSSKRICGLYFPYNQVETESYCYENGQNISIFPSSVMYEVSLALALARDNENKNLLLKRDPRFNKWEDLVTISVTGDMGGQNENGKYKPGRFYATCIVGDSVKQFVYLFTKADSLRQDARQYLNDVASIQLLKILYCELHTVTDIYENIDKSNIPQSASDFEEYLLRGEINSGRLFLLDKLSKKELPDTPNSNIDLISSSPSGGSKKLSRKKRRNRKRSSTTRK